MWNGLRSADFEVRGADQQLLHERASAVTRRVFGERVFVRAVVEVSNFCRENCHYCGMRRDNRELERSRLGHDELAEALIHHRPAAVTDVNIQAGEDPVAVRTVVLPLIHTLRRQTTLGISVCLGTLEPDTYAELRAAGASIYILKFETADEAGYARFRAPGTRSERLEHIRHLSATGWRVSSGFISGLPGQTPMDLLNNCQLARELPLDGASVSPFIAGEDIPLAGEASGDVETALNCMAMLRITNPRWVIPAVSALNLAQPGSGYIRGLRAGANLVTINLTPRALQRNYVLYKRDRFIMDEARVMDALAQAGLVPSSQSLADFYVQQKESQPDCCPVATPV
ncbi:MAG TPA: radical SAM protein [Candidatus Dormibacteraeota bacterium]|nr:radical SAM protein [Candidatus Dormibacteraeota bacterium]